MILRVHPLKFAFVLSCLCLGGLAFPTAVGQTIHYDSGYTWRGYTGSTAPVCSSKLCQAYAMHSWDTYYRQFTAWKSHNDLPSSAHVFINFRVVFPAGYNFNDPVKRYPITIFLHGAGESGRKWTDHFDYDPSDPKYDNNSNQLRYGANEHRLAAAKPATDPKAFPGIVVFPQVSYSASWSDPAVPGISEYEELLIGFIESQLVARYHGDANRISLQGISNGGRAAWAIAQKRPDLFAAIVPMSAIPNDRTKAAAILLTTSIRIFQGGEDLNPTPGATQDVVDAFVEAGGNPQIILYPESGHETWSYSFKEADFFPWLIAQDKRKIFIVGGQTALCSGAALKLGFSANMLQYQWMRDGKDIVGATSRFLNDVYLPGKYAVKFKRPSGIWDESFSLEPLKKSGCPPITAVNGDDGSGERAEAYPNPTRGRVAVNWEGGCDGCNAVRVLSVTGQTFEVPTTRSGDNSMEVDLSALSPGLYLLQPPNRRKPIKIVKE